MADGALGLEDREPETQSVRGGVKGSFEGQIPFLYASESSTTARR